MALATAVGLGACGAGAGDHAGDGGAGPGPGAPPSSAGAWLELGTGQEAFAPMGDAVTMALGPQGTWMLVLALRGGGFAPGDDDSPTSPDNPLVEVRATSRGEPVGNLRQRLRFAAAGEALVASGLYLLLDPGVNPGRFETATAHLLATVTDRDGRVASAEREVAPRAP